MQEWAALISNYGFPIFVAVYLLVRLEPTIKQLDKSITVLAVVIAQIQGVDYEKAREMVEGTQTEFWRRK